MLKFEYSSLIKAPLKTVWEFHEREDILDILTPPWQPVKVVERQGGLEIGAMTKFNLMFGFVTIPWCARHVEYEKYHLFTDQQTEGPLKLWIHRHQFQAEGDYTRLTDNIQYDITGEPLINYLMGWWVEERLKDMFAYRHRITKENCESQPL
ncbi:cyclase/dehydrase [Cyanobacterium stanieri PCC 7202]|uniref:Cyclase/dehydrase n=1 Tax=Cyanobacterium stanieri (strain ATCC 29140 / PCC 7202) TaxID=292563 RepID=K9YL02_CYASC|nr:cyclase/dehydrase [Cyanobacterium stanieri PCC 7202]